MKYLYIFSLFTLALCLSTNVNAQDKTATQSDKKVIVIKKTVNEDGTVTVEKTVTVGDDANAFFTTDDSDGTYKVMTQSGASGGNMFFISSEESSDGESRTITVNSEGNTEDGEPCTIKVICNEEDDGDGNMVWVTSDDSDVQGVKEIEIIVEKGEDGMVWVTSDDSDNASEKQVEVNVTADENGKVITIVSDGKTEVIEVPAGGELSEEQKAILKEKGVFVSGADSGNNGGSFFISDDDPNLAKKIKVLTGKLTNLNFDYDFDHNFNFQGIAGSGTNCIALGVFVNSDREGGVKIQSIIKGSGAEDAGLQSGDVIHRIGEDAVENFRGLHEALSNYEPGEVVSVEYEREGVRSTVESELRAWGDLPGYENSWRAQVKCGEEYERPAAKVSKRIIIIKKNNSDEPVVEEKKERDPVVNVAEMTDYSLNLEKFSAYPNPTDGKFRVEFQADAKPLTVSVFDATGKEIYRDNVKNFDGYYSEEIDLRGKSQGALILSIAQDGKRYSEQIILQ